MLALALIAALVGSAACSAPVPATVAPAPAPAPAPTDTTIGEFRVARVVDGDTIRVAGLDSSLRLLGIDTEETFKHDAELHAFAAGWQAYVAGQRGSSPRPVKMATPLGMAAKQWAEAWFAGVGTVRLERDHPAEIRDRYGRYLAYVLARKDGAWLNYNVEAVRAGMSPYFPKYGRSRRYHAAFVAAEAEAKAAQRGIWAPGAMAYPDYAEREAWWSARGDFIEAFRTAAAGDASYIDIAHDDALARLAERAGKQVTVLGTVGDVRGGEPGPAMVMLSHGRHADVPLIFFDRDVLAATRLAAWKSEPIIATGVPTLYENRHTHETHVQIVIDRASQIRLAPVMP